MSNNIQIYLISSLTNLFKKQNKNKQTNNKTKTWCQIFKMCLSNKYCIVSNVEWERHYIAIISILEILNSKIFTNCILQVKKYLRN